MAGPGVALGGVTRPPVACNVRCLATLRHAMINAILSIVMLTGGGISAESGVAPFRCLDGLWEGHRMEEHGQSHCE